MVKYSIIVPVFNLEQQIGRCIESLLRQSYKEFEIIIIDDGSSDKSLHICKKYAKSDSRIKIISKENTGVSAARNNGLEAALGEYLVFVDGDDYVDTDYLKSMNNSNADLVMSGFNVESEEGNHIDEIVFDARVFKTDDKKEIVEVFEKGYFNSVYSKRFLNKIIKKYSILFDESLCMGEDACFVLTYLKFIHTIELIKEIQYHYVKYHSQKTLTNRSLGKKFIDDEERADDKIFLQLKTIIPHEAKVAVAYRIGRIYQTYIEHYFNNTGLADSAVIRYLYKKKWFRYSLLDQRLYNKESKRFRALLKTRCFALLMGYKLYKEIKDRNHLCVK